MRYQGWLSFKDSLCDCTAGDVRKLFELLWYISILSVDISASVKVSVVYHGIYSWILDINPHGYEYGSAAEYSWYYPCHCLSMMGMALCIEWPRLWCHIWYKYHQWRMNKLHPGKHTVARIHNSLCLVCHFFQPIYNSLTKTLPFCFPSSHKTSVYILSPHLYAPPSLLHQLCQYDLSHLCSMQSATLMPQYQTPIWTTQNAAGYGTALHENPLTNSPLPWSILFTSLTTVTPAFIKKTPLTPLPNPNWWGALIPSWTRAEKMLHCNQLIFFRMVQAEQSPSQPALSALSITPTILLSARWHI